MLTLVVPDPTRAEPSTQQGGTELGAGESESVHRVDTQPENRGSAQTSYPAPFLQSGLMKTLTITQVPCSHGCFFCVLLLAINSTSDKLALLQMYPVTVIPLPSSLLSKCLPHLVKK